MTGFCLQPRDIGNIFWLLCRTEPLLEERSQTVQSFESELVPNRKVGGEKLLGVKNCFLKVGKCGAEFVHIMEYYDKASE